MAYSTSLPPALRVGALAAYGASQGKGQIWTYQSTDALAVVVATNYITNAQALGMQVGDVVEVVDTATPAIAWARLTTVATSGTIMSAGLAIT